jgi:hypothetical protein
MSADRPDGGMVMLGAVVIEGKLLESKFNPVLGESVGSGR